MVIRRVTSFIIIIVSMVGICSKGYCAKEESVKQEIRRELTRPKFEIQIGENWTRERAIYGAQSQDAFLENLLKSSLIIESGTGFYLGKILNEHIVATNKHVLSGTCFPPQNLMRGSENGGILIKMTLLNVDLECERIIGSWDDVDLTLLVVRVSRKEDESKINSIGLNFQASHVNYGEPLLTAGYGIKDGNQLYFDRFQNCKIFSETGIVERLKDPDEHSPSNGNVLSLAHGCNMSHGDSGSALVSKLNGRVVGINWTVGRTPRFDEIYSDQFLEKMEKTDSLVWSDLNYASSSSAIIQRLKIFVTEQQNGPRATGNRLKNISILNQIIQNSEN